MLKWLQQKAEAAAANQCRVNIRLNVKHLAYAVENNGNIEKNQHDLAKDMALGISNGLSVDDVINESKEAVSKLNPSNKSLEAFEMVYASISELDK